MWWILVQWFMSLGMTLAAAIQRVSQCMCW